MSRWTAVDLPDLSGRTVVVTGANSGIGLVAARQLAGAGAHVVLAVRDVERGAVAARTIDGSTDVRRRVRDKFGVELEPEVKFWGF